MLDRWVPVMFWEVLITSFLSRAVQKPCLSVMFPVRMLSIAPLKVDQDLVPESGIQPSEVSVHKSYYRINCITFSFYAVFT